MKSSAKKSALRNRQLRIEALESRELLSVNPLGIDNFYTLRAGSIGVPVETSGYEAAIPLPSAEAETPPVAAAAATEIQLYKDTLSTIGEGPVSLDKIISVPASYKNVKISFRFASAEYPNYVGTKFNDYFQIYASTGMGGSFKYGDAINTAPFNTNGQTPWYERTLAVNPKGDTVSLNATIANVGDSAYQSSLEMIITAESVPT